MLDGLARGASYAGTVAAVDEGHATVMVLLPTVDGGSHRHGPCPYQHSVDGLAPRVGEGCLVVEDEGGGLWVASRALDRGWSFPAGQGAVGSEVTAEITAASTEDRKRSNHTGTQTASTISDFATAAQGAVGSAITAASTEDRKRSNHTGVQAASTISDLAGVVKAYRLDEFAKPTATVDMNLKALSNVGDPAGSRDAVPKQYVDNTVQGLSAKLPVRCATTGNISLISSPATIDGVTLASPDRVLVKDQAVPADNGIYGKDGASLVRVADASAFDELVSAFVFVEEGDSQADTGWLCTVDGGGTLGTSPISWVQFSAAGQITAGDGLTKAGQVLSVADDGVSLESKVTGTLPIVHGGTGATTASAARSALATTGKYGSATHAAGTTITISPGTHGLAGTPDLVVSTRMNGTGETVLADTSVASDGTVTIVFGESQAANTIRTTIIG